MTFIKKYVSSLLVVAITFTIIAAGFIVTRGTSSPIRSIKIPQSIGTTIFQKNIVAKIIAKILEYILSKLGKVIRDKVWPAIKNTVQKVLDEAKKISIKGPGSGERVFAIYDNGVEVFRLDAKLTKKNNGYYLYVHYHIKPDMSDHHDVATIYMGKNKPPGWN